MKKIYLVDLENVGKEGIKNIESLTLDDQVHLFSTEKAGNVNMKHVFTRRTVVNGHIVPEGNQSVDKHIVSFLGYLLGKFGDKFSYIIISKDKGYERILDFWREEGGFKNISRTDRIPSSLPEGKVKSADTKPAGKVRNAGKIRTAEKKVPDADLAEYMKNELRSRHYTENAVEKIADFVVTHHSKNKNPLRCIHNDIKRTYDQYEEVYAEVKMIYSEYTRKSEKSYGQKNTKKDDAVRDFVNRNLNKEPYEENMEKIIGVISSAETKSQVNKEFQKMYPDGDDLKELFKTVKPLISKLPAR